MSTPIPLPIIIDPSRPIVIDDPINPMPVTRMPVVTTIPAPVPTRVPIAPEEPGASVRYGGKGCFMNRSFVHPTQWQCQQVQRVRNNCNPPFGNTISSWGVGVLEANPCDGTACNGCPSIANIGSINYRVGGYC